MIKRFLSKVNSLNDYQMQLWLDKKGHKLYDPIIDNEVDMENLCELAIRYGFKWNAQNELWTR